jgi:hypothetical protein
MPGGLTDADWSTLLQRIADKECTPFVGAGASAEKVPVASELALEWAREYDYPLADATNLARVAQYLAVEQDPVFPKQLLRRKLQALEPPDFDAPDEPHAALADLDLPIYLTTNYDGLMLGALRHRGKEPKRELCGWNDLVRETEPSPLDAGFTPSAGSPLVYYLHGHCELPQSMVLTEDDYLAFLVRISTDNTVRLLPSKIRSALATTSLLFVGYSLSDWDFRVLFRGLMGSLGSTLGMTSVAVQLDPSGEDESEERRRRAQEYLNGYFEQIQTIKVRLFWGDVRDFSRELRQRLEDFRSHG